MTDTTSQAANTTDRWYVRARAALRAAITSAPLLWARGRTATSQALAWFRDNPMVMAVFVILAVVSVLAIVSRHPLPAPSSAAAPTADQLQPIEARVSTLETAVAGLLAAAPAPTPANTREPGIPAPATTSATPAQPFGTTDLDRRLADFQRRFDATPH